MNTFFTSDSHFGHANIIKYCDRPFKSVQEMDDDLIGKWNSTVGSHDVVYHLGDFCFGNREIVERLIKQLNGKIYFIMGSHDSVLQQIYPNIPMMKEIKLDGISITLCHYAMKVWPKSHYNSYHLYGHSHGNLNVAGKCLDVGVDVHDFYPISWEKVEYIMKNKSDNFNLVKRNNY